MSEQATEAPAFPRTLTPEAALERGDCADCHHWTAGNLVLRGNTRGRCAAMHLPTSANFGCDVWTRRRET